MDKRPIDFDAIKGGVIIEQEKPAQLSQVQVNTSKQISMICQLYPGYLSMVWRTDTRDDYAFSTTIIEEKPWEPTTVVPSYQAKEVRVSFKETMRVRGKHERLEGIWSVVCEGVCSIKVTGYVDMLPEILKFAEDRVS